ncbi:MAG: precorrin-3B C(17)-methyltransferase [Oligoflexia bacterium]|nr:precorrin-3B C(17)-methyltransferase [Oligoflexia bacterium]
MDNDNNNKKITIAIIAITEKGSSVALKIQKSLEADISADVSAGVSLGTISVFNEISSEVFTKIFSEYNYIICIFSLGIVVRFLAPLINDKRKDPAVLCIDEHALNVISVLSGHIGGANSFCRKVANLLAAAPVITTSSDVQKTISADILGSNFANPWTIDEKTKMNLHKVSKAIVNGKKISVIQEAGERRWWQNSDSSLPSNISISNNDSDNHYDAKLLITDRDENNIIDDKTLIYRPKSLVVGIGCDRHTSQNVIERAVLEVFNQFKLSINSIHSLASIDLKKDEIGLLEYASKLNVSINFYSAENLQEINESLIKNPSEKVKSIVGSPSVAEAAALVSASASATAKLIVTKQKYHDSESGKNVTVAICRRECTANDNHHLGHLDHLSHYFGELAVVGIGPGNIEQMTIKAYQTIKNADVVIGHITYIALVEKMLAHQEIIVSGMKREKERAQIAIDKAHEGKRVAIISSGDATIYGMAALVCELLQTPYRFKFSVIAGVTAAQSVSSLLGAPLTDNFCTISLSDLLTPWERIEAAIESAAKGDFEIVFYNPSSTKRKNHIKLAHKILSTYRPPNTPVGVVKNAFREGEECFVTTLESLLDHQNKFDMFTTILIGNSNSYSYIDKNINKNINMNVNMNINKEIIITPRGYRL